MAQANASIEVRHFSSHERAQTVNHDNRRARRRSNRNLSIFLIAIVAVSPLPLGSNRPAFWAISALFIALAGLRYALKLRQMRLLHLPLPIKKVFWVLAIFCIFLGYLVVQIVPFGTFNIATGSGVILSTQSISLAPGSTVLMLMRQLSYGLFFFLALQVAMNPQRANRMLLVIFFIAVAYALYAMLALTQFGDNALIGEKTYYRGSATGTFINRNSFATFLGMGAVAGLSLLYSKLIQKTRKSQRSDSSSFFDQKAQYSLLTVIGLSVIFIAIIATQSRMGTFSAAFGLLSVSAVVAVKAKTGHIKMARISFVIGIAIIAVLAILFGEGLFERLGSTENSFDVRAELYAQVVEMIKTRPWTGFGGGSFKLAYPLFHQLPVSTDLIWDKAHSTYLTLWSELGILIGSLPLLIFAIFTFTLLKQLRYDSSHFTNMIAALGTITVVALHSLLDFSLEIQANTYLFLIILALGVAGGYSEIETAKVNRLKINDS
ncbi:MAG: O-antigen ligase family protein [Hyphomicrobiales bacterium]|nr:O-antigen ligase family protein [Hyphomicrobiales bacterium]